MTTEEAIQTIETAIAEVEWNYPMNYAVAFEAALTALRAQQEAEKNEPLTLEELRGMDGEPYWHVGLQKNSSTPHWAILPSFVAKNPQDYFYGKQWLAYRHKLKEETS